MHWTQLLIVSCAVLGCATPRASEVIPLVPVMSPATVVHRVALVVADVRIGGDSGAAEDVLSNDVAALVRNRVEYELAQNGVVVDSSAQSTFRVELYDFRYRWSRPAAFVESEAKAVARMRLSFTRDGQEWWSAIVLGQASTTERNWKPVAAVADQLERALDDAMKHAHERRLFVSLD